MGDFLMAYSGFTSSSLKKNLLINGNFDIWQRNTTQTSAAYASDDRWINDHNGSTKIHSRQSFTLGQTDVPNEPAYYSRTVVTSSAGASNYVIKQHRIESVRIFAGQTVTLSFWAKADATKNIATEFGQIFGSGGSPSGAVTGVGATLHSLSTSWKKFFVTTTIPSISGKTLGTNINSDYSFVSFWFDAGSSFNSRTNSLGQQSGTFDIAQVQLEIGQTATEFERRHISEELALCQRYYEKSHSIGNVPGSSGSQNDGVQFFAGGSIPTNSYLSCSVQFVTRKKANPTITTYDGDNPPNVNKVSSGLGPNQTRTIGYQNDTSFQINTDSTSGHNYIFFTWTADSEI
jgi:hypothetical protein